jgi:hypothetical protein
LVRASAIAAPRFDNTRWSARAGQQAPHVFGMGVMQFERTAGERLQIGQPRVRLEALPLARREIGKWRDPDHVAVTLHCQTIDIEQGVERSAPRHLVEPQRHRASNPVAGDDVQAGELRECIQYRAQFGTLEVQRDRLIGRQTVVRRRGRRVAEALRRGKRHGWTFERVSRCFRARRRTA